MPTQYFDTPLADENQDVTQSQIRQNFQQANTSFGTDHYSFDNLTANNGFHKKVTTPDQGGDIATTTNPTLYAKIPYAAVGLLQFSRGPSNAVPSPVTFLQSPSSPIILTQNATTNVLDFTGFGATIATLYAIDTGIPKSVSATFLWTGSTFYKASASDGGFTGTLSITTSGNILQVQNSSASAITFNNVYWTLQFLRIQ